MKKIKEDNTDLRTNFYTFDPEQKSFTGAAYEALSSIKLKKGKYLITFSFNLKATNQWMYLYMNQG